MSAKGTMFLAIFLYLTAGAVWAGGISSGSAPPMPCEEGRGTGFTDGFWKIDQKHSCPKWRYTCVIDDERCPLRTSPPYYCPDGETMTLTTYVSVGERLSCSIPHVACVKQSLCPQFDAPPPSFCPDGVIETRVKGFFAVDARYSCPQYEIVCVKRDLCPYY